MYLCVHLLVCLWFMCGVPSMGLYTLTLSPEASPALRKLVITGFLGHRVLVSDSPPSQPVTLCPSPFLPVCYTLTSELSGLLPSPSPLTLLQTAPVSTALDS